MISIERHMDEYDIAQEVRMERKVHKGSFLLLEGITDIKRFVVFIDDAECSIVNCFGRPKAIKAIKMLYEDGFPGALGVVDADFDRLEGTLELHEGLVYSCGHDLDIDWAQPSVVHRYLLEVGDSDKCQLHGSAVEIIEKIMTGLKPASVSRLMNHRKNITYKLSQIDVSDCFANFALEVDKYVDFIFMNRVVDPGVKDRLKQQIELASTRDYDLFQLTNGHDFHCALGASLRADLGSRHVVNSWGKEVESHIRLAFTDADFKLSSVFTAIRNWLAENQPYRILHSRLS